MTSIPKLLQRLATCTMVAHTSTEEVQLQLLFFLQEEMLIMRNAMMAKRGFITAVLKNDNCTVTNVAPKTDFGKKTWFNNITFAAIFYENENFKEG